MITSVLIGIGLAVIGIPYVFLLSVFAFALSFLPVLGVYITSSAILLVALTQGLITALITLAFLTGENGKNITPISSLKNNQTKSLHPLPDALLLHMI